MNNFERTTTAEKKTEKKKFTRSITFDTAYTTHINSGLDELGDTLEALQFSPDRSRAIYAGVVSTKTNAAFDLDISRRAEKLDEITIGAYGGSVADPAFYRYSAQSGTFTKQTKEHRGTHPIEIDEIISRLASDYPDNSVLQDLHDSPTEAMDPDFILYILENALTDYAEEHALEKATQSRYTTTSLIESDSTLPTDRISELLITKTGKGTFYQLDIDEPYQGDVDVRKAMNYQVTHTKSTNKWHAPTCTAMLYSEKDIKKTFAQSALKTEKNDAYFTLLQGIDTLARSGESTLEQL